MICNDCFEELYTAYVEICLEKDVAPKPKKDMWKLIEIAIDTAQPAADSRCLHLHPKEGIVMRVVCGEEHPEIQLGVSK